MNAAEIIRRLNLQPHPKERGYFLETYRSEEQTNRNRSCSTAIYFLLDSNGFSEMHRLKSDEIFHFYKGAPLDLILLYPNGEGRHLRLGSDLEAGEIPQVVIPQNCWQGMRTSGEFSLIGCTVSPGFHFSDYESGVRKDLIRQYPDFRDWITRLTVETP